MKQRIGIQMDNAAATGLVTLCLLLPRAALACPVCFGEPDSNQARGLRAAILVLGGVAGLLVTGMAGVVLAIRRRAGKSAP